MSYRSVLRRREFAALSVAHLLSLLGDRVATVAISVLVFDRSGSVLLAATAYATSMLPWLLGAPFLAALSDRWPRRRVLLSCDVLRALLVLVLAVPGLSLPALLVLLTAVAWLGPPFEAARAATMPLVLPTEQEYVTGTALTMLSNQLSQVIGLAGGGLLLTVLSTQQALLLDSASFLMSAALISRFLGVRPAAAAVRASDGSSGLWRSVVEGAHLTFGDRMLRSVLLLAWLMAALTVLPEGLAVAAARSLDAPAFVTGLLMASVPAGAAVGAVVLGRLGPLPRARSVLPLSVLALAALAASAAASSWRVLFVLWLLVGVGASVQLPASAVFMRSVPDAFRARAFGLAQTGLMAGQGLALVAAGAGAEQLGIPTLLGSAGGLGLVLLLLLARRWPASAVAPLDDGQPRPRPRRSWPSPVDRWIGIVTLLAVASVTTELVLLHSRPAPWSLSPWLLVVVFFATGAYVATIRIGRQAHVFQLDDIPRLVGLVFLSPAALIGSRLLGGALALVLIRHQRGRKLLFNLASYGLEMTVALATFSLLDPGGGIGPEVWPAAFASTVLADLVSAWTVGVVIGLAEDDLRVRRLLAPDRMALGTAVGAATVGTIAVTTLWYAPSSGALVLMLVALGMLGLRAFGRIAAEGRTQQQLQAVLAELGDLEGTEESLCRSLEGVRQLLAVETLECWVAPAAGDDSLSGWFTVHAADSQVPPDPARRDEVARRALQDPAAGHTASSAARDVVADPPPRARWRPRRPSGVHRLAVALAGDRPLGPLHSGPAAGSGTAVGALVATAPLGDARAFTTADADLLQTVAGMLSQALRRVEHRQQLLLHVTQDRLTAMCALSEFRIRVAPLLEAGTPTAMLMINLDRLRAVNDVFGRDTGDRVIAAAAQRTRRLAPPGSVLGRVSGHHFACAFPTSGVGSVTHVARRLRAELEKPLAAEGVDAEVGVHIGISLAPEHGADPDVLLRRAETAGDAAKEDPFGVAVFVDTLEQDVARPLRLVRDLRAALEEPGQLAMHYQPKLSLGTGDVLGCEALLRWKHPELGPVPPDEFIGLAESTGLITDVTTFTLDEALRQAAQWHGEGLPANVAVNLSARTLLDGELVRRVSDALDRHGLEPKLLTLEITETSVMAQPMRSVLMLDALSELGVQLSIDDFGTGYSNLVYLRQLPVQEVKLDRTFLDPVRGEPPLSQGGGRAYEFLRHAIALVHSLGLYVVVEGVEDEASLDALRALGADSVQGYFICRPLPAGDVTAWMVDATSRGALGPPQE